jgi:hypothetical protein
LQQHEQEPAVYISDTPPLILIERTYWNKPATSIDFGTVWGAYETSIKWAVVFQKIDKLPCEKPSTLLSKAQPPPS